MPKTEYTPPTYTDILISRFDHRYQIDEQTGCWIWHGTIQHNRPIFWNGKKVYAHRWYWEYLNGPVPSELELDHLCRQTLCVNPDHLEAVTHKENTNRGIRYLDMRRDEIGRFA